MPLSLANGIPWGVGASFAEPLTCLMTKGILPVGSWNINEKGVIESN